MTNAKTKTLAWIGVGLVAFLVLAGWVGQRPQPDAPAVQPDVGPPPDVLSKTPEALAGGELRSGQWHFGYTPDPAATRRFLATLPRPTLAQAAPHLLRADDHETVLLYRALYEAHAAHFGGAQWRVGAQGIGDCVSWGWAHGADICLAVDWKLGKTSEWRPAATEAIYGGSRVEARGASRGGYADGSYGGAAAKWVSNFGVLFRQPYPDLGFDLTTYDRSRAKSWGNFGCGGDGDSGQADQVAKQHPIRQVALVRNFDEAAAAIASGYPVPVCSGQGFSSRRDEQGFCAARGSWSHCMCFVGVRYDRPGLLCLNSWGPSWVGGPKWPEDQPDGSFWVDKSVADRMLRGEDSFAVSGYEGFPWRDLRHGDWASVRPKGTGRGQRAASLALALAP
jgi:hypothetical protein